ncbi:MAG: hypothetical protein ACRDH8_09335 [Actinomycetota bacterium]|jgi:hypothetical protein
MHVPQKRQRCPHCRALDVIPILYGLSALERLDAEARGEVIVGGPLPFAEQWHCRSCGWEWGRVPTETYPSRHALTA